MTPTAELPSVQASTSSPLHLRAPLVIAHRGASGHRPEHTLAAYELAMQQGADFIELDLVASGDGHLLARHENLLAEVQLDESGQPAIDERGEVLVAWATTDVAERSDFADRLTVKFVDGRPKGGWFTEDFTRAELKTLRARERMPMLRPMNRLYDDRFEIPTLEEVIALVRAWRGPRPVGLYIELKHPTYFAFEGRRLDGQLIGLDLTGLLLQTLREANFLTPERLFIQCFEVAPLLSLKTELADQSDAPPLIQLFGDIGNARYRAQPYDMVYHAGQGSDLNSLYGGLSSVVPGGITTATSYAELAVPAVLTYMAEHYASGIGPPKYNVLEVAEAAARDPDGDGRALQSFALSGGIGAFVSTIEALGLKLHPYTLRAEEPFLIREDERILPVAEEAQRLLHAGADGFFIDQPSEGRAAVAAYLNTVAADADQATPASEF
jgi:glycerophosphoryl diester phosphodiesterase